ncbi:lachrymatory-factor synthase-like [Oryza brachyantha]|uniref:lachrymatory-factor synthase-like n=1 Tax=Oryza brachyantha TaxID=4533 RepID=UPI001AD98933|nr:lachrymatory-factor synthase-like [Oryza brachyantha]
MDEQGQRVQRGRGGAPEQWRGAVEAALPGTPASAAWPHVASFLAAHRYLPGIDVCERVHGGGEDGPLPGCVRHVASSAAGLWAREELLEADHSARRLRYAVVASNMGFGLYIATLSVLDDGGGGGVGCRIAWAFECDAVRGEGLSEAALVARLGASVKGMAERVQQAVAAPGEAGGGEARAGGDLL